MARRRTTGGDSPSVDQAAAAPADPEGAARTICLRLLTIRARTRAELADALAAREVPAEAADAVLDRLAGVGLIDDEAFAASFVSSRHNDRGLAAREITRQLRQKGVEDDVAQAAVLSIDADAEQATARRLVERKLRSMSSLTPEVQTRRLAGLLARKGYSPAVSFQVVRDVLGEQAELADDDTAWLA